jgi:hypothetical protein
MRFGKNRSAKFAAVGLATALMALVFSSLALAASHNPKGEYAQFNECPLNRVTITDCVYSVTKGGSFTIGKKTVPIVNPVTLQGGYEGAGAGIKFYGAENGVTLSKTPQPVPGGLLGIVAPTWWPKFIQDWFNDQISKGFTGVNATVELTGPSKGLTTIKLSTENLLFEEGTALGLPSKVKLDNAILGSNCYIGSTGSPLNIETTTGTSGALKGAVGELTFNPEFTITTISGGRLVDNQFTAPGVSGCGGIFSIFVNPLVDSILGTPSGKGKNSAILEGKLQDAVASSVKASE